MNNLLTEAIPYPNTPKQDLSSSMKEKEFDLKAMFQNANEFFSKMGLIDIPKSLWNNSIFEQLGDGKNISCDATSWDFYDGKVLFLISFKILVLDEQIIHFYIR